MNNNKVMQLHVYVSENGEFSVPVVDQTVWLSLSDLAQLYGEKEDVISQIIADVMSDDELDPNLAIQKIVRVGDDGEEYEISHYNFDVVMPVGYRVNSKEASRFRKWAQKIINDYLTKGVVINEPRLNDLSDEVLERIASSSITRIINTFRMRGLDDRAIRSRLNGMVSRDDITSTLHAWVVDNIYYGRFTNRTYLGLFGRDSDQLKAQNGGYKPRDGMTAEGLDFLSTAESSVARLINKRGYIRYFEALTILDRVCRELEPSIKGLQRLLGIDLATNQPLLPQNGGDDTNAA